MGKSTKDGEEHEGWEKDFLPAVSLLQRSIGVLRMSTSGPVLLIDSCQTRSDESRRLCFPPHIVMATQDKAAFVC